jgi:protein-S-isoprenylcysteine O-methyltransferase Ste14
MTRRQIVAESYGHAQCLRRSSEDSMLKERVPELGSRSRMAALYLMLMFGAASFIALFVAIDRLVAYGAVVSQLMVASWVSLAQYYSMRYLVYQIRRKCREDGVLPGWVLPAEFALILAPWWACLIHPLMVGGELLLPSWVAVPVGLVVIVSSALLRRPAILGGFTFAHSLSIYLFFPEHGSRVSGGVYSYLRHPAYAMGIYMSLGFAILRNNLPAILVALIFAAQHSLVIRLEDKELVERFGDQHRRYVKETPAIFPRFHDLGDFTRLLFLGRESSEDRVLQGTNKKQGSSSRTNMQDPA